MVKRRPPDRRERIAAAASILFRQRGFRNVSMSDVAESVGITAPALYRHFDNKSALLAHVVTAGLDDFEGVADGATNLGELLRNSTSLVFTDRGINTLWYREARHLPEAERADLGERFATIMGRYSDLIREDRPALPSGDPQLLAGAVVGVLCGQSATRPQMAKRRLESVLTRLLTAVSETDLGVVAVADGAEAAAPRRATATSALPIPRREQMLTEAVRLFDERGFQSVGIDEIGEAVGTSGPNVYKHFANKDDILVAALIRAGERRDAAAAEALAVEGPPLAALERLLRSYIAFARANTHLIGLLSSEVGQLPEQYRRRTLNGQREYMLLWARLLESARPGVDPAEARIGVMAVLNMVGYVARNFPPDVRGDASERMFEIGWSVLAAV